MIRFVFKHKLFAMAIFCTAFQAIESLPEYKPFAWIDCKQKNGVWQKKCFDHISYVSSRIEKSGLSKSLMSPSHISFIMVRDGRYSSYLMKELFANAKVRTRILGFFREKFRLVLDSSERFALI